LVILPLEPQLTEFQQKEPFEGRIILTQATTSIVGEKKTASRSFPVEVSAHTEEAHEAS